jgi:hypothetical protein
MESKRARTQNKITRQRLVDMAGIGDTTDRAPSLLERFEKIPGLCRDARGNHDTTGANG